MRRGRAIGSLALAACVASYGRGATEWVVARLSAQTRDVSAAPVTGTAVIAGTVLTDDEAHRPVSRATVSISGSDLRQPKLMSTDEDGHFAVTGLPAGTYHATVTKPGFVATYYGSRHAGRSPGTPFALAAGQHLDLTIPLAHGAALTGVITDSYGRPLPDVRVTALEYRLLNGERRLSNVPTNGVSGVNGTTDEHGTFRLWGLPPGTFLVEATPSAVLGNQELRQTAVGDLDWAKQQLAAKTPLAPAPETSRPMGYTPVYYPGVTDWTLASQLVLGAGQERGGLDFQLALVPTATIAGTVLGPDGQPATTGVRIMISLAQGPESPSGAPVPTAFGSRSATTDRTGHFSLSGIAPGQYTLTVRGSSVAMAPAPAGGSPAGAPVGLAPPPPPPAAPPAAGAPPAGGGAPPPPPPPVPVRAGQDLYAAADLAVVGDDVKELTLVLRPGMTVSGSVTFKGTSPVPTDLALVRIGLNQTTPGDPLAANIPVRPAAATGTFTLTGVLPGHYRPSANLAAAGRGMPGPGPVAQNPWHLASALWQGRDLLDGAVEVRPNEDVTGITLVFSDLMTELSGSLVSTTGAPIAGYFVVVFPTDPGQWRPNARRIREMQPQPDGSFKFTNLPPGEYYLGAVTDIDNADLGDPSFLEQLAPASLKLTLADGQAVVQSLRLRGGTGGQPPRR